MFRLPALRGADAVRVLIESSDQLNDPANAASVPLAVSSPRDDNLFADPECIQNMEIVLRALDK